MSKIETPQGDPITHGLTTMLRAAGRNNLAGVANAIGGIVRNVLSFTDSGLQRLWQLAMYNGQVIQRNATFLEVGRLTDQMIIKALVDKGILTQEELEERQKKDVEEPLEEMQKEAEEQAAKAKAEMEAKLEEAQDKVQEVTEKAEELVEPKEEEEEPETESDVELASERAGNILKFPAKKEEDGADK